MDKHHDPIVGSSLMITKRVPNKKKTPLKFKLLFLIVRIGLFYFNRGFYGSLFSPVWSV